MQAECTAKLFEFEAVERRSVVAGFDGGAITSNAGALLLGQVDHGLGLIHRFAQCFMDRRDSRYVEHRVGTLVGQRVFGLVLGYEDLNDHDELRKDPTLAVLAGKLSPVLRTARRWPARARSIVLSIRRSGTRRSITRSIATGRGSMPCWWMFSSRRTRVRHARSCSISTIPTSRCTASRRAASFTATTTITAICRCTCSVAVTCYWRGNGAPMSPAARVLSRRWRASLRRFGGSGRAYGSSCAGTVVFPMIR